MKTVLVLAVSFPPTGGVGVIRTLKFVKYLPQFGWQPVVVTLPAGTKTIRDDSLAREVPEDVVVHRPPFFEVRKHFPKPLVKLWQSYEKRAYFPDKYARWNGSAYTYIQKNIIGRQQVDLVYASVGPHSTLSLAHKVRTTFGIPAFIDFRDPFSFSQYALLDTKKRYQTRAEAIEKEVFRDVDQINNVSRIWQEAYIRRYPEIAPKACLIHNGYDEDDFAQLSAKKGNAVFTIGYNGTYSRLVPIDPLMTAIRSIHERKGISVRLSIATPIDKEKFCAQHAYHVRHGLLDHKGFLPHRESLENLFQADISALILNDIDATLGMIPAKTFEYLRIGNPVLLLHRKDGHLAEIIAKTKTGTAVDITDSGGIEQAILMLHDRWQSGNQQHRPDWEAIKTYERRCQTRQLAAIFDRIAVGG